MPQPPAKKKIRRILLVQVRSTEPTAAGAFAYARRAGWVLTPAIWYGERPSQLARHWGVEGIIIRVTEGHELAKGPWQNPPVPVVDLSYRHAQVKMPRVREDFTAAGAMGAQHLVDRGFQHLAYAWLGPDQALDEQLAGFRSVAENSGGVFHLLDWSAQRRRYENWTATRYRNWLLSELRALPRPLGLMVESDWTGLEAVEACRQGGLLVPEEVAIVGCFNDVATCEGSLTPLSSVDVDEYRVGYEAARLLDGLMSGRRKPAQPTLIPPKGVVVRQSSDILAVPHVEVAKALRFIWENYRDSSVGVPDIVAATVMSKPGLNKAFRAHLGCAVGEQLRRVRLEQAERLLTTTDRTIKDIAKASGYGNAERLRDTLVRKTGLSPRAWRAQARTEPERA